MDWQASVQDARGEEKPQVVASMLEVLLVMAVSCNDIL